MCGPRLTLGNRPFWILYLQNLSCVATPNILFYITASAIMQDFRDNEKKIKNGHHLAILDFIPAKFIGYPCMRPMFCFIFMVQVFFF